jgi:hypothetical protein
LNKVEKGLSFLCGREFFSSQKKILAGVGYVADGKLSYK